MTFRISVTSHDAFVVASVIIFSLVSFNFLFPCNRWIPLDRRTTAVVGALACYLLGAFIFPSKRIDLLHAIDFDVLVLLASIMVVNHLVVHLRETKKLIYSFQSLLRRDGIRGFWMLSFIAFIVSPFLTNDGVCLLLVEPVLNTFEPISDEEMARLNGTANSNKRDVDLECEHFPQREERESISTATAAAVETLSTRNPTTYDHHHHPTAPVLHVTLSGDDLERGGRRDEAAHVDAPVRTSMTSAQPVGSSSAERSRLMLSTSSTLSSTASFHSIHDHGSRHKKRDRGSHSQHRRSRSNHNDQEREAVPSLSTSSNNATPAAPLTREDAFYFLLALACSTNIGSALTYTGNPQNMIVASDAIDVMPPYKFTLYMILPSLVTWFITIKSESSKKTSSTGSRGGGGRRTKRVADVSHVSPPASPTGCSSGKLASPTLSLLLSPVKQFSQAPPDTASILSPRRRRARSHEQMMQRVVRVVSSPLPYIVLILLFVMIVMIFVDIMPISSLICVAAIVMVLTVVFGNHCCRQGVVWESDHDLHRKPTSHALTTAMQPHHLVHDPSVPYMRAIPQDSSEMSTVAKETHAWPGPEDLGPMTHEDKLDSLNEFFEELFKSIDYSLLFIFLGTFIVVENMAETGIPKALWQAIVGKVPFGTVTSITGISVFIVVASQLLGNVAVVQLAKPNVGDLPDAQKRMAWAIISFVSTVGGNLTITGSAANIIVAEKANRLDPTINMNFFRHFKICFAVTLVSCAVGAAMLYAIISLDNYLLS
eukprot:gene8104-5832_t